MKNRISKTLFFLLITTILFLGTFALIPQTANGQTEIWNWAQLDNVRNDLDGDYILMTNLNSGTWGYSGRGSNWTPIGDRNNPFTGTFDGNGHTISDLVITGAARRGFIGQAENATVRNLGIVDVDITVTSSWIGALIGHANGNVTVTDCYSTGVLSSTGNWHVGGLIGRAESSDITRSWSSVNVTHTPTGDGNTGGLVGSAYVGSSIDQCFAVGDVTIIDDDDNERNTGGLVGYLTSDAEISDSYARGNINGWNRAGGLVGLVSNGASITNSYATGIVTGNNEYGGLVGHISGASVTNSVFNESNNPSSAAGTGYGRWELRQEEGEPGSPSEYDHWDFNNIWDMYHDNSYPFLRFETTEIEDWHDLDRIRKTRALHYVLQNDLDPDTDGYSDYTSGDGWEPLGEYLGGGDATDAFRGIFDGDGYVIDGLTIDVSATSGGGLFGHIFDATIVDVGLLNVDITARHNTGALVGRADDSFIWQSYAHGTVISTGTYNAGGLIGSARSIDKEMWIRQCFAVVDVDVTTHSGNRRNTGGLVGMLEERVLVEASYARGDVYGGRRVGGLVGLAYRDDDTDPIIRRSYSTGAVDGTGIVGEDDEIGGFTGRSATADVYDCFWDTETSGQADSWDGTGRTTSQMKTLSTFTGAGWDFTDIWDNSDDRSYPWLQFEDIPPIKISDWNTLNKVRQKLEAAYVLRDDLDSDTDDYGGIGDDWTPIGNSNGVSFIGEFDGDGHTISDLEISGGGEAGFIGHAENATVLDLGLLNVDITASDNDVGALIGRAEDGVTVSNCYSTGNIESTGELHVGGLLGAAVDVTAISNSWSSVNIIHKEGDAYRNTGGLVGYFWAGGTISESFATGNVNGINRIGGLVGRTGSGTSIYNSYARGNVFASGEEIGGLVGRNWSDTVENSYSSGWVTGSDRVGGLFGDGSSTITNSFWDVDVSGQSSTAVGGTGRTHTLMKEQSTFDNGPDWDFGDIWAIEEGHSYPYLQWEGIETAPNEVTSWTGLDNMGDNPHRYYYLSDSLDAGSAGYDDNWSPISGFTGLFDGNNYIIDDFKMDAGGNAGFFGSTDGAAILNVAMRNVDVKNTTITNVTGTLAGTAASTNFFNCSITGTFQTTTTAHRAGGLVGYAEGNTTIRRCWTSVDMDVPSSQQAGGLVGRMVDDGLVAESFTTGNVNGSTSTGGLLGRVRHNSQIINSYARGNVSGGSGVGGLIGRIWDADVSVTNSYSTGYVNGSDEGGLVGISTGTVEDSFWDTQTSGQTESDGGTGKNRAEMRKASTFTGAGWDFTDVWDIHEDNSYPFFRENHPTPHLDWLGVDTGTPLRPHWFSYNTERGMAIVEEGESTLMLVPSVLTYSDDVHIHIIDAETGKDAGFMNLDEYNTGEVLHPLYISDVAVSDDNKIFISNYVDDVAQEKFRVQMYEDTGGTGHVTVLEDPRTSDGNWSLARTITITGSYTLGTATLYAVSEATNQLVRYTQTGPGETFENSEELYLSEAVGSNPTASAARPGTAPFYQTGGGQEVRKYDADGTLIGTIPTNIAPEGTNRVQFLGTSDAGDDYIAVYDYDDANALLIKVPDGDPTVAEDVTTTASLGSAPNPDGTGDIRFVDTGDGYDVYLLATNNGIKASRMDWEEPMTFTAKEDLKVGGSNDSMGWRMFSLPVEGVKIEHLSEQYFVQGYGPDLFPQYGANILFVDAENQSWSSKGRKQDYELQPGEGFIWFFYNDETGGYHNDHPLPVWLSVDGPTPEDDIEAYSLAQGSNLIGNPFNRDLDVTEIVNWVNQGLTSVVVHVWDNKGGEDEVDSENGGYSHSGSWRMIGDAAKDGEKIAPWQGFVLENDNSNQISFPIASAPRFRGRERGFYKSEEKPSWHRLSFSLLNIEANGNRMVTDEAASLLFHPEASEGWDIYDAGKMTPLSDRFATLSFLGERNGESILKAQESRPLDFEGQIEIPVSFESYELAGNFEIKWDGLDELPEEWYLMLADHEAGTLTDLRLEESLVFSIEEPLRRSSARDEEAQKGFASSGAPAQLSVEELAGSEVLPFMESLSLPVHFSGLRKYGTQGSATRFTLIVSTEPISGEILADLPKEVELSQNYPNPFNPVTVLPYALPEESHVRLTIYDVLGRQVAVLVDGVKEAGRYEVSWDATRKASGVYIYRMEAGGEAFTRKMTLVK